MPAMRTYIDNNGVKFRFNLRTEVLSIILVDGTEVQELMNKSLAERLTAQGVPPHVWKGSQRIEVEKAHCPICNDTGYAYGGICVCVYEGR